MICHWDITVDSAKVYTVCVCVWTLDEMSLLKMLHTPKYSHSLKGLSKVDQ